MKFINILTGRFFAALLTVGFIIYFIYAMIDTGDAIHNGEILLSNYEAAIVAQEEISESIDYEESIEGSDEQIEQIARERLGLCKSNEKLFIHNTN